MRSTKIRSAILAAAAISIAFMMATPMASAQAPTLEITSATGPQGIRPEIDNKVMDVDLRYTFDNQLTPIGSAQKSNVPVTVVHDCPNFVIITGPGLVLIPVDATTSVHEETGEYGIAMTRSAPGLTQIPCDVTATGGALNQVGNTATDPVTRPYSVQAAYYGAMQVQLGSALQKAGPQKEVNFPLTLTNFGNAKTSVIFSLGSEPSGKRWEQLLPPPVIVDTAATGQNNVAVANFQVSTPYKTGWNNELGGYQIVMNTVAFDDPNQKGNTLTADVLVRVRGVFVPGFEVVAMVGTLLGSVVLTRRRE